MSRLNHLIKPEYVFRPRQVWTRIRRSLGADPPEWVTIQLPWGLPLHARSTEIHGRQLLAMGILDLPVTEVLWRLLDPGETAVDVGSNLGYMTSLMAARVGPNGRVLGFEPHPEVFHDLEQNAVAWRSAGRIRNVTLRQMALAEVIGRSVLDVPESFADNRGLSRLRPLDDQNSMSAEEIGVQTGRLDDEVGEGEAVGVLKIDVEGQELRVCKGSSRLLHQRSIRDIVFEEQAGYPTPVTRLLEDHGYTLFTVRSRFVGPLILPAAKRAPSLRAWEVPSILATLDPRRAVARMAKWGWQSLRTSSLPGFCLL